MLPTPAPLTTETIWAEFHQELHRFVRRRVRDPAAAQDLLQEIFIKIHLRLATLAQAERLAAWVYQIARHTVLDYLRQRRPAPESADALDALPAELAESAASLDFSPCLQPFLRRLPPEYREALQLTELGSLSQK